MIIHEGSFRGQCAEAKQCQIGMDLVSQSSTGHFITGNKKGKSKLFPFSEPVLFLLLCFLFLLFDAYCFYCIFYYFSTQCIFAFELGIYKAAFMPIIKVF